MLAIAFEPKDGAWQPFFTDGVGDGGVDFEKSCGLESGLRGNARERDPQKQRNQAHTACTLDKPAPVANWKPVSIRGARTERVLTDGREGNEGRQLRNRAGSATAYVFPLTHASRKSEGRSRGKLRLCQLQRGRRVANFQK